MQKNEYEVVEHNRLKDVKLFLVDLAYRNLHMHNDFELCYVLAGQVEVYSNRTTYLFSAEDLVLFNPRQAHEIHAVGQGRAMILSLQFSPRFCSGYFPLIRNIEFSRVDISGCLDSADADVLKKNLLVLTADYLKGVELFELMTYAQLNQITVQLARAVPWRRMSEGEKAEKRNISDRIVRILDYIEHHFTEKILLSDIARREDLSLYYLSHFFKDNLNMTFQDYVTLLRFEEARALIARSDMKITDICFSCGFSDHRYMSRIFEKQLGCSPSEYRDQIRQDQPAAIAVRKGAVQHVLSAGESLEYLQRHAGPPLI